MRKSRWAAIFAVNAPKSRPKSGERKIYAFKGREDYIMEYNYLESMVEDILDYINYEVELSEFSDREELEGKLNDDLWVVDSVTGNASGSYTFNTWKAKEYVTDNMELLIEMAAEFGIDDAEMGRNFREENWEYFDVSIRCFLLGQAIAEALDRLNYNFEEPAEVIVKVSFLLPEIA